MISHHVKRNHICVWKCWLINLLYYKTLEWSIYITSLFTWLVERKFNQWWSTIPPTSTKRKVTSHLISQHIILEIQVLTWDRHKNVAGLNRLTGSQPSLLIAPTVIHEKNKRLFYIFKSPKQRLETYCFCSVSYYYYY